MKTTRTLLLNMYESMYSALGPSYWWPGESRFEVIVGAILTQNTSWSNVERAINNLKLADLLSAERLFSLPDDRLSELIRPSGYFRLKTKRLKNVISFLRHECGFDIDDLARQDTDVLRQKLLAVKGVGPETADSILLYALDKPSFVVDAYTHRMFQRHGLIPEDAHYEELRAFFMDSLPEDLTLYNEYHALIVRTAKEWCGKKTPRCEQCPLQPFMN